MCKSQEIQVLEGNVRRLFLEMDIGPTKVVHQEVENEVEIRRMMNP